MSKLFTSRDRIALETVEAVIVSSPVEDFKVADLTKLDEHVFAFNSLVVVHDQIASESFSMVGKDNYILYNEYILSISRNLDFKPMTVSLEAVESLPAVVLNHHLSLEGFIGDLWKKIKAMFASMYEKIKAFFKTYFTRLGRLRKSVSNMIEVLGETTTDLKKPMLDSVPSGIASAFPVSGTISLSVIESMVNNAIIITKTMTEINAKAKSLAAKEVLDRDFVDKLKSLKTIAAGAKKAMATNKENTPGRLKSMVNKEASDKRKELNKQNESLSKIAEDADKETNSKESTIDAINSDNADIQFNEDGFNAAKKEFEGLMESIEASLHKVKDKPLAGGYTISSISIKTGEGVDYTLDKNKESPSDVTLSDKTSLIALLKNTLVLIDTADSSGKTYGEVNDTIIKSVDSVDKLVSGISDVDGAQLGKYKTILNTKIRERLSLIKNAFTNYNKVNKLIYDVVITTGDGVAKYSTLSLKNFG